MAYVIAAYALVIASLAWYGWRIHQQRRQLERMDEPTPRDEPGV